MTDGITGRARGIVRRTDVVHVRARDARLDLTQHGVDDERCPTARPDLTRRGVEIALACVAECTARRKIEGGRHTISVPVVVLEHVRGDNQPSPGEQALRRWKPGFHQPQGQRPPGLRDQPRQRGWR